MLDFHLLIIEWFRQNKRDLPWRRTKNPYRIWLSEVILQQTRVNQGMDYYLKFVANYPTIEKLAAADEQEVLSLWQGLGYYSRARNLHHTAKVITNQYKGRFPREYEEIRKLKGIGDYTAAAIASFAYDLPFATVDGNVYRVLSRIFDIETPINSGKGKKEFDDLANELLNRENPGLHNQAMMEFGALYCVPSNPNCEECPLQSKCLAFQNGTVNQRPQKDKKINIRKRKFHFFEFRENGKLILEQRIGNDIWKHLYQFPLLESDDSLEDLQLYIRSTFDIEVNSFSAPVKHILTHQNIEAIFWSFESFPKKINENWIIIDENELSDYPIPRLIDRFLEVN